MTLVDEIRSRGHWSITVRPDRFDGERVAYEDLLPTLRKARVQLTGWDFPHVGADGSIEHGANYIGFDTDTAYYREAVRFGQSGQFSYLGGVAEDWYERGSLSSWRPPPTKPGELLGLGDTLTRYTEVFEFSARLAESKAGDQKMVVAVELRRLRGRRLYAENRARTLSGHYVASMDSFGWEEVFAKAQLLAEASELALLKARDLFLRFGAEFDLPVLRDLQSETRRV